MPKIFDLATTATVACALAGANVVTLPDPIRDVPLIQALTNNQIEQRSIVLAGGCFWGIEAVFKHVKGVVSVVSGYAGGRPEMANYNAVSTGTSGHAEAVKVTYDPSRISLGQILKVFFSVAHNPTEQDRQGPDQGTQYRSAIFYATNEQKEVAEAYIDQLQKADIFPNPIVTKLERLQAFYPAEEYHQNYAALHPDDLYISTNDMPKVRALKKEFPNLYEDD